MAPTVAAAQTPLAPGPRITLQQAIAAAEQNEPTFAAARAASRVAELDRGNARAALLPSVVYHNQLLYTQPNGVSNNAGQGGGQPAPIFIANNAVREYASLAAVTETISVAGLDAVRAADAAAAAARADMEVQRRGLATATVNLYDSALSGERRVEIVQGAREEAQDFLHLTEAREQVREAAHADVVKAELTLQQRTRDVADAQLAERHVRLELGVLLFQDPRTPFVLSTQTSEPAPPRQDELETAARRGNPELASAMASLRVGEADVAAAKAAYLPSLALNVNYGIDASELATEGPLDTSNNPPRNPRNLGYSATATLDVPVWDWLATARRVKQAEARRAAQRVVLSASQRRLIAGLEENYEQTQETYRQLASLQTSEQTAQDSLRMTRLRYASGEGTVLEVVDAEAAWTSARLAHEDGRMRYRQALTALQLFTGDLR